MIFPIMAVFSLPNTDTAHSAAALQLGRLPACFVSFLHCGGIVLSEFGLRGTEDGFAIANDTPELLLSRP